MVAVNLVDSVDGNINYGMLLCENENISSECLRDKMYEIKDRLEDEGADWIISDIINGFPKEWKVRLQEKNLVFMV